MTQKFTQIKSLLALIIIYSLLIKDEGVDVAMMNACRQPTTRKIYLTTLFMSFLWKDKKSGKLQTVLTGSRAPLIMYVRFNTNNIIG